MRAGILLTSLLCLVGACVVDESKITLICDGTHPCPEGQSCGSDGICVPAFGDMGMTQDQGTQQTDLRGPAGCAGSGAKPVGQAVACPGAFAEGQAASLCDANAGYHICRASELSKIDVPACNQLPGFFILADVPGYYMIPNRSTVTCGVAGVGSPVWFGCGGLSSALVREHAGSKCSSLDRSVDCSMPAGPWICRASGDLARTENKATSDGVVCCK